MVDKWENLLHMHYANRCISFAKLKILNVITQLLDQIKISGSEQITETFPEGTKVKETATERLQSLMG